MPPVSCLTLVLPVVASGPCPSLACDAASTVKGAVRPHAQAERPNLFIKIPGTSEGQPAIEEALFQGAPVNVTLLFSAGHYGAAAEAYLREIEHRTTTGLDPKVPSVASMFISRWDKAVTVKVQKDLQDRLGIAIARHTYKADRDLLASPSGGKLPEQALNRGACSGRAPAPKIPRPPMSSTSRRLPRRTPSIRLLRRSNNAQSCQLKPT